MPQSLLERLRDAANMLDSAERSTSPGMVDLDPPPQMVQMSDGFTRALAELLRDAEAEVKKLGR